MAGPTPGFDRLGRARTTPVPSGSIQVPATVVDGTVEIRGDAIVTGLLIAWDRTSGRPVPVNVLEELELLRARVAELERARNP